MSHAYVKDRASGAVTLVDRAADGTQGKPIIALIGPMRCCPTVLADDGITHVGASVDPSERPGFRPRLNACGRL
jgi:hypothetical protein